MDETAAPKRPRQVNAFVRVNAPGGVYSDKAAFTLASHPPDTTVSLGGLSFKTAKTQNFFGGGESFGVEASGDLNTIASIELIDGNNPLQSNGMMQRSGATTYLFSTPGSDIVTLKVSIREGISRHTVKF